MTSKFAMADRSKRRYSQRVWSRVKGRGLASVALHDYLNRLHSRVKQLPPDGSGLKVELKADGILTRDDVLIFAQSVGIGYTIDTDGGLWLFNVAR